METIKIISLCISCIWIGWGLHIMYLDSGRRLQRFIKEFNTHPRVGAPGHYQGKKSIFRVLTKEEVEADRSKAYNYINKPNEES